MPMTVKSAQEFGKISTRNSKMPGTSYAVDAFACKTGSKLAKVPGSPCSVCYARKLQNLRPSVDKGWKENLAKWEASDPVQWAEAMAFQISRYSADGYHRWFDSGDLQSVEMLWAIAKVCEMTPLVRHWLPTQERGILKEYLDQGWTIPDNLVVRVSASMVDGKPGREGHTSNVVSKDKPETGHRCPASKQGNNCGDCRACWNPDVRNVSYVKH